MVPEYQLWFVPTRCAAGFNWQPELLLVTNDLEEAQMAAYLERQDEPAPDKDAYMLWHIEEISK